MGQRMTAVQLKLFQKMICLLKLIFNYIMFLFPSARMHYKWLVHSNILIVHMIRFNEDHCFNEYKKERLEQACITEVIKGLHINNIHIWCHTVLTYHIAFKVHPTCIHLCSPTFLQLMKTVLLPTLSLFNRRRIPRISHQSIFNSVRLKNLN